MSFADGEVRTPGGVLVARMLPPDPRDPVASPRPAIHPLTTPSGVVVSDLAPPDHPWHRGLSLAISNIDVPGERDPVNLWGGPTFTGTDYEQLDNNGAQVVDAVDPDAGSADLTWVTAAGRAFAREHRTVTAELLPNALLLHWRSEVRNLTDGTIGFGSPTTAGRPAAGYGGLFLRGAPLLAGAEVLVDGTVVGIDAAMGRSGRWAALRRGGVTVAMAAADTAPWFVRTDPHVMLCAAPFFSRVQTLGPGEGADWAWRVLAADGEPDAAALEGLLGR